MLFDYCMLRKLKREMNGSVVRNMTTCFRIKPKTQKYSYILITGVKLVNLNKKMSMAFKLALI